jgi:hypothetical protein
MATSFQDEGWSRPPDLLFDTAGLQIGKHVTVAHGTSKAI